MRQHHCLVIFMPRWTQVQVAYAHAQLISIVVPLCLSPLLLKCWVFGKVAFVKGCSKPHLLYLKVAFAEETVYTIASLAAGKDLSQAMQRRPSPNVLVSCVPGINRVLSVCCEKACIHREQSGTCKTHIYPGACSPAACKSLYNGCHMHRPFISSRDGSIDDTTQAVRSSIPALL